MHRELQNNAENAATIGTVRSLGEHEAVGVGVRVNKVILGRGNHTSK